MFYENLLRHHHHLLYQKELEVKALKSKPAKGAADSQIQAQVEYIHAYHSVMLATIQMSFYFSKCSSN